MKQKVMPRHYDLIIVLFVASLLISNLAATKLVAFGPIITDGGALLFPLVYILGDVLTEVYGFKYARRAIWTGFAVMLLAVSAFTLVRYLPAAPEYTSQESFDAVLGFFPRIVLASLAAYLVGSFLNAYVLARLKVRTGGKKLWFRLISSTVVGQFFDTLIFGLVAFLGILGFKDMMIFLLVGWIFKTVAEIILLPVTYRIVGALKKSEQVDALDSRTSFNPLKVNI